MRLTATTATLEQSLVLHLRPSTDETLGARITVARGTNHVVPPHDRAVTPVHHGHDHLDVLLGTAAHSNPTG